MTQPQFPPVPAGKSQESPAKLNRYQGLGSSPQGSDTEGGSRNLGFICMYPRRLGGRQSLGCSWRNSVLCDPAALSEYEMEKVAAVFGEPSCDGLSETQTVS